MGTLPWSPTLKTPFDSSLWHPLNIPLPRAPSERELQHGDVPAGCAVLSKPASTGVSTHARAATLMVTTAAQQTGRPPSWSPPLGGGRVLRLQSALRQIGRYEEAELCEAAARQGAGEQRVRSMPAPRRRDRRTSGLSSLAAAGWRAEASHRSACVPSSSPNAKVTCSLAISISRDPLRPNETAPVLLLLAQ